MSSISKQEIAELRCFSLRTRLLFSNDVNVKPTVMFQSCSSYFFTYPFQGRCRYFHFEHTTERLLITSYFVVKGMYNFDVDFLGVTPKLQTTHPTLVYIRTVCYLCSVLTVIQVDNTFFCTLYRVLVFNFLTLIFQFNLA